jgi:uncharacterized membrane-anchored protein
MNKIKPPIIILNLALLLYFFNMSVIHKEGLMKAGTLVFVELAPVDPRSLMQGDYMRLSYRISQDIPDDSLMPSRGYCVVRLNADKVAQRVRFQSKRTPLSAGEHLIEYTAGDWTINIGAESYFFQEGKAEHYSKAKYGGLRIDRDGNSLLTGLYDAALKKL